MFIDTHAHFGICMQHTKLKEHELLSKMQDAKVEYAVQVSTEQTDFKWCRDFALKHQNIFFTLGIHPSSEYVEEDLNMLVKLVSEVRLTEEKKNLFGIGEAGLDYYWMAHPKGKQIKLFEMQINIAKEYNLPVIVHTREAMQDTIGVLKSNSVEKGIIHCFSGTKSEAAQLLDMGLYISFAGNVTFKKSHELQDVALYVPVERLLLETDCPYLTPAPKRGRKNRPDYVVHTYNFIAELHKQKVEDLAMQIKNNFIALSGIK
jgi:TatD DNase family protein